MGFLCCICHEDLSRKKPNETQNGKLDTSSGKQDPTVVATKCGHLYHSECLSSWFEKKGREAWTTRECPSCRMELTVVTDVIRIFFPLHTADEGVQTLEEIKSRINKLENANKELASRLELSFLGGREQDKKIYSMTMDKERLQKAYIVERSKAAALAADCAKLKSDNEKLKTVIIDLNVKAMSGGVNGMNMGGMQQMMPGGYMPPPPRFPEHMMALGPRPGNINLVPFNYQHQHQLPHASVMHGPGPMMGHIDPHWPPKETHSNGGAPGAEIGMMVSNLRKDPETLSSQLSSLLLNRENAGLPVSGEQNSLPNGFSGNSNGSGTGSHFSERGDTRQDITETELLPLLHVNYSANNSRAHLNNTSKHLSAAENESGGLAIPTRTSTSDAPTDELMDEILRAKPQPIQPTPAEQQSLLALATPKVVSNENSRSKSKTKWKAIGGLEDEKKIYGKFYCKTCTATWGNARHILNQPQSCRDCGESTFPYAQVPVLSKEELTSVKVSRQRPA